jgi:hypothetical protein
MRNEVLNSTMVFAWLGCGIASVWVAVLRRIEQICIPVSATPSLSPVLFSIVLIAVASPPASQADVNMLFSTGNYGLQGSVPGSSSSLLSDAVSGLSGHITTRAITPAGGFIEIVSTLGINGPGVDCDNCFDQGEAWTFSWDAPIVFKSLTLGPAVSFQHLLLFSLQSDAWKGQTLNLTANESFDTISGAITITFSNATSAISFPLLTATDGSPAVISPNTFITLSGLSTSQIPLGQMVFSIVPEPPVFAFGCLGGLLILSALRFTKAASPRPFGSNNRAALRTS